MHADALSGPRWNRVSELIAARTGLHFPPERRADLQRALGEAATEFGCRDGDHCAEWLLASPLSREELSRLARHLTIGETYFFRERPSFNALASHVLPVLIHRKRGGDRRLRLWSAACSTGEEAYSLAMLVQQVLPDWRDWDVSILGTDLNPHSLRKAEAGIYGEWSFRDCAADIRERFFSPVGDRRHRVGAELRGIVKFAELNLAQDAFPSPGNDTHAMDLVLCRNLLIYFTPTHARRLIGNLHQALVDGGWLIVSPSECSQALFRGFTTVNFPGSILYRKRDPDEVARTHEPAFAPAHTLPAPLSDLQLSQMLAPALEPPRDESTPRARVDFAAQLADAEADCARGEYAQAADKLRPVLSVPADEPVKLRALGLLTRALANQGALDEAQRVSERWIAADKLDAAAHYLHAMVSQELGDRARARASLQRAVYLHPEFTLAHFALGNHARAEARVAEARRHFANAARLLEGLPADSAVPESEGLTAGRLREIIVSLGMDT
jgi:chemotaxis protein methyltransferase CheR